MMPVPGGVATADVVMQCAALAQGDADHGALGFLGGLANGLRHFTRLARTEADAAIAVAHHNQCTERKAAATLDHLGDAIDAHQLFDELALFALAMGGIPPARALATSLFLIIFLQIRHFYST